LRRAGPPALGHAEVVSSDRARVARSPPCVILDPNVLTSGIFFGGVPGRLLMAWRDDRLALVLSPAILAEYREAGAVLAARYATITTPLNTILALIAQTATIVVGAGGAAGATKLCHVNVLHDQGAGSITGQSPRPTGRQVGKHSRARYLSQTGGSNDLD
jgi:hypothetical protein